MISSAFLLSFNTITNHPNPFFNGQVSPLALLLTPSPTIPIVSLIQASTP